MNRRISIYRGLVVAASGAAILTGSLRADAVDSLVAKLVAKGVLTDAEGVELAREARQPAAPAPAAPAAAPAAVSGLRLNGELRLRYEGFYGENPAFVDRDRFRLRLRLGGTVDLPKNVEVGVRLTTGVSEGEPTGNNATFTDNASKKAFALDLAYAKWTAVKNDVTTLALVGGKMNNPFTSSDLVFDGDYTPEGFAVQYSRKLDAVHTVRFNGAQFVLDENSASAHDPMLAAGQLRWDATWSKQWSTTAGLSYFDVSNAARLTNTAVPDVHKGNTRTGAGVLVNDYRPYVFDVGITRTFASFPGYPGAFPVRVAGDYLSNTEVSADNRAYYAGVYFGKAAKGGTWEFNYRYRVIEADAWYEELADSDSGAFYQTAPTGGSVGYGGGTNVRGHIFAGNYAITDNALVGFTLFSTRLIKPFPANSESGMTRLQLNSILKF